jgi:hypothetical protein
MEISPITDRQRNNSIGIDYSVDHHVQAHQECIERGLPT